MLKKATADFREASEKEACHLLRQTVSANFFLIVYLCRSGSASTTGTLRRGKEDAFEKHIAGRWHIITLQEASEYVDHEILRKRLHVTHLVGCAIDVSSIGIYFYERFDPLCGLSILSCYQVLVWHRCCVVFTSCSASQSRPLPCFPPGFSFSEATTFACCPCHLVSVTSTIAVGRVAKFARR